MVAVEAPCLLNIPGTPASAATTVDGYPLAQQGFAGKAIGMATTGSFVGSVIGLFCLAIFTPLIGNFALNFQSFEFFTLAIFGVVICGNLTAPKDPMKGWISGFLGLFIAMIGMESIHAHIRFSFGSVNLASGIDLIPAMVGVFGFSEILMVMKNERFQVVKTKITRVVPKFGEVFRYWKTIIRSGLIGVFVGAIPGVGEDIAAWVSYDFAKNSSKEADKFGKGSYEGLIASETANNAACGGTIIPVLSLAIPGSAPAAVLMAAMFIHGVRPGPLIMIENPEFVFRSVAMMFLATFAMFILGLSMVKWLVKVLLVPREKLMPIVFVLCLIGTFALESNLFDVTVMMVFGLLGFFMKEMDYPVAPLVLGVILGGLLDQNLRRALIVSNGNILQVFARPISLVIVLLTILTMVSKTQWFRRFLQLIKHSVRSLFRNGAKAAN